MFSHLHALDRGLYGRYLTLEKNVRAASNSFYDSYIDLTEQFLRFVLRSAEVNVSSGGSTGSLLRHPDIFRILVTESGVNEADYEKIGDYIRKVNEHKHKSEKKISIELVVRYLSVLHAVTGAYASHRGIAVKELDPSFISDIFDSYERENGVLRAECERLVESLDRCGDGSAGRSEVNELKEVLSSDWFCAMPLERQNEELRRHLSRLGSIMSSINEIREGQRREEEIRRRDKDEILGAIDSLRGRIDASDAARRGPSIEEKRKIFCEFVKSAEQEHLWLGDERSFFVSRLVSLILLAVSAAFIINTTLLTTKCAGLYTTYTFFENIWFIFTLLMLRNTFRSQRHYSARELQRRCHIIYEDDGYGVSAMDECKKRYIVFLVLGCISALLNLFCIWDGESPDRVLATVLELVNIPLFITSFIFTNLHFSLYTTVKLTGINKQGKEASIVVDPVSNQMYPLDDYYEKCPWMR